MISTILKIRAIQLLRLLKEIGLLIHTSRKDKLFLKMHFNRSYLIFLVEYLTIVFPVMIVFCIYKDWPDIVVLFLFCFLVPLIYFNTRSGIFSSSFILLLNPFSQNLSIRLNVKIPINDPKSFEWISGFRRYFIIIIPVYLLLLAFSFKAYVAPIGLIIVSILISGFYYYGESREFIELYSWNYTTFLLQKIKQNLKYTLILSLPVIVIALIFQSATWYYLIGALIIAMMIQIITIIFKYALFAENSDLGRNAIIVSINIICILLPFLWPLPIIMCTRYYIKAQNNLKKYLNDFN